MAEKRQLRAEPVGDEKTIKQALLQVGAKVLQGTDPLKGFDIYAVGFHCAKKDPEMQSEAHHYCKQVNEDFLQCLIFDGNTENANLMGVEYIISEPLFAALPAEERSFWHPHNYEILSGLLVAPDLPAAAEKAMLKLLMNSYGKTWHLWHTGRYDGKGHPADRLPLGEPVLMWSFNRDGEIDPSLLENFNKHMKIQTVEKRRERQDLVAEARPQEGVDALKGKFPGAHDEPPPGVQDKKG